MEFWDLVSTAPDSAAGKFVAFISSIFGVGTTITTVMATIWAVVSGRKRKALELDKNELKQLAVSRKDEIRQLKASLVSTQQSLAETITELPQNWLETVEQDRQDGNEERAINTLNSSFEKARVHISEVCVELAEHHAALMEVSASPEAEWRHALRLAETAARLAPEYAQGGSLAEELTALGAPPWRGASTIELQLASTGFLYRGLGREARSIVSHLSSRSEANITGGRYSLAKLLAKRAVTIGTRELGERAEETLVAQYWHANAMNFQGEYTGALKEVTALLVLEKSVMGPEHPTTLSTRYLRASILDNLGEHNTALEEVTALLPLAELELENGPEHRFTLTARWLQATILENLGEHTAALVVVKALLPLMDKVHGPEHPSTLPVRFLRGNILYSLGEYTQALEAANSLLPIMETVLGSQHPFALSTRHQHATILDSLGEYTTALEEVETLLSLMEAVNGSDHPYILRTRWLECRIRIHLGEHTETIKASLESILEKQKGLHKPGHKYLIASEQLLLELQSSD